MSAYKFFLILDLWVVLCIAELLIMRGGRINILTIASQINIYPPSFEYFNVGGDQWPRLQLMAYRSYILRVHLLPDT